MCQRAGKSDVLRIILTLPRRCCLRLVGYVATETLQSRPEVIGVASSDLWMTSKGTKLASNQRTRPISGSQQNRSLQREEKSARVTSQSLSNPIMLYKFPWMRHLRFISRLKQFQVGCVVFLTFPISYWYQQGVINQFNLLAGVTAATATTAMLFIFSYFFRRIVGELQYNPQTGSVQLSTLTFWSQRRDQELHCDDIIPLSETRSDGRKTWQRLEISGHSDVYLYSLRLGKIYDRELLGRLLGFTAERKK